MTLSDAIAICVQAFVVGASLIILVATILFPGSNATYDEEKRNQKP